MASLTRWTWVWVNSGRWWWTGRPGVLQFMRSQRVRHDWATELNQNRRLIWYQRLLTSFWAFLIAYYSSATVRNNQSDPGDILHFTIIKIPQNLLPHNMSRKVDSSLLEILQLFKVHFIEFFHISYRIIILIKVRRNHQYLFGVNIHIFHSSKTMQVYLKWSW